MYIFYFNSDTDFREIEDRMGKPVDAMTVQELNVLPEAVRFDFDSPTMVQGFMDAFNDGELNGGTIQILK